jgi:hypothetical protein
MTQGPAGVPDNPAGLFLGAEGVIYLTACCFASLLFSVIVQKSSALRQQSGASAGVATLTLLDAYAAGNQDSSGR